MSKAMSKAVSKAVIQMARQSMLEDGWPEEKLTDENIRGGLMGVLEELRRRAPDNAGVLKMVDAAESMLDEGTGAGA